MKENQEYIDKSTNWYTKNRNSYEQLTQKVHNIVNELLDLHEIGIHAIFSRTKEINSFKEKIKDPKYTDPSQQITDLSGIRIICYVEGDIKKICDVIEKNFDVDQPNSGDKSELLGTDKVGYKSYHYVAKLSDARTQLPEYKNFFGRKFEVQIRTILQHAWAEIEHDRNYKFSGELPPDIQRRFKLVAGTLELADMEFNRIASDIDQINAEVEKSTKQGKINFEINSTTLKQFLLTKFESVIPNPIDPNFPTRSDEFKILSEIDKFGLTNLGELNDIVPTGFIANLKKTKTVTNFLGLLRHLMIISDAEKYFQKSYDKTWSPDHLKHRKILQQYGITIEQIAEITRKYYSN